MQGLDWQPLQLPLAAGLNQRPDDRALQPPELAAAINLQFDELGGLQTRKPFALVGSSIAGGGTLSTARRMYEFGNELLVFSKDSVYSWNDQLDRWVFRATHLAIAATEKTKFATPGDQYDCDRAELSGIVFTAWCDADKVYMAVEDKATGAVLLAPTAVTGSTHTRPRLVAVSSRVLLFCHEGTDSVVGNITVRAFDPTATDPATWSTTLGAAGVTVLASASSGAYYDVTRILTTATCAFVARRAVTTSYEVATITDASTPVVTASTKARTCDGPIAVASHPSGTHLQVIRANGTNIQGDYLLVNLTDVTTGQAVGTTAGALVIHHIAAAYRSVQNSSQYRCYVFWSYDEAVDSSQWATRYNYVDTGGTIGTEAIFVRRLGIGSRAFDHDGSVFVWGTFAGESNFTGANPSKFRAQLQNTYFLYRDDATIHSKCALHRGGGLAPSKGRLPGVALTSGTTVYSWCATERRIISIGASGEQKGFDARAPRDVVFTFDTNDARRCVRLGETLYISGADVLQYDGVGLYEVGFYHFPWTFQAQQAATGNVEDGTYTIKVTWRWENAKGEMDRSTTATHGDVTVSAGPKKITISNSLWTPLFITRKATAKPISVEVWRTAKNPPEGAPFYLVSSKDPASTTNPNRYVGNDAVGASAWYLPTFNDEMADSTATTKETNDENGDVLENLAPPGATVIAATDTRVFLGNVAGDPDRIWYSKLRQDGRVVSFHDALTFDVPKHGGTITGIAFQSNCVVVFRQYATYMFPGDGYDNTGRGVNYGPFQEVSNDVGCRDTDSIVVTPEGIAFQSSKGKYLLTRGWTMKPIGLPVSDYDSETVLAAHVMTAQHQVRFVTGSRILVWDYLDPQRDKWNEWTLNDGVLDVAHAGIWRGTYHYLAGAGAYAEQSSFTGVTYGMDWETAWIKPNDLQGAAAARELQLLGEQRSTHHVRTRVAYDFNTTWVDDNYKLQNGSAGTPLRQQVRMSRRRFNAFKLRVTIYGAETKATRATSADLALVGGTYWTATLQSRKMGPLGNGLYLAVRTQIVAGSTLTVEVRDGQVTDASGVWSELADHVGVHITQPAANSCPIQNLENALIDYSDWLTISAAHGSVVNISQSGQVFIGATAGGAFAAPTGESLKVTGLAMEVGIVPRVNRRYAR